MVAESFDRLTEEFKLLCQQVPEILLYYMINTSGGSIWYLNHEMADRRLPESPENHETLALLQEKVRYAVDQTTRFGVTQPRDEAGNPTDQYWRWFQWWDAYTRHLPPEEQDQLFEILDKMPEVIKFRPQGDWREPVTVPAP